MTKHRGRLRDALSPSTDRGNRSGRQSATGCGRKACPCSLWFCYSWKNRTHRTSSSSSLGAGTRGGWLGTLCRAVCGHSRDPWHERRGNNTQVHGRAQGSARFLPHLPPHERLLETGSFTQHFAPERLPTVLLASCLRGPLVFMPPHVPVRALLASSPLLCLGDLATTWTVVAPGLSTPLPPAGQGARHCLQATHTRA